VTYTHADEGTDSEMNEIREKIIIVDDVATNLNVAKSALSEKYDVFTAPSGDKLFSLMKRMTPDLILLDVEMPEMDGYEVITVLKASESTMDIPVIFLTGKIDPEHEIKGLNFGAVDYVTKPFSRELLLKRIDLHVLFERQKKELLNHNLRLESEVDRKTKTVLELQTAILKAVAELVECRDNVTGGHIERTQYYLSKLIRLLIERNYYTEELSALNIPLLIMSSQLHDVGKISIKDSILLKPGPLDNDEIEEMKKHAAYGAEIIERIESSTTENDFLHYAQIFAGTHHERWDGNGYPHGLKGEDIPLPGRLMAIVDVYDALTNDRPYKKAYTHDEAVEIIKKGMGTQFDPVLCEIFVDNNLDFKNMERGYESTTNDIFGFHPETATGNTAVKRRDGKSNHTERIQDYLEILFDAMLEHDILKNEISDWDKDIFLMSAHLHDIGGLSVSDSIYGKIEHLPDDESREMKSDTNYGLQIVKMIKDSIVSESLLHHAEMLTGNHHEKWDGTGYPLGLKGKGIPLEGRLMAIVDVYDSLTSDRPHRKRKTHEEAAAAIIKGSSIQFDPDLVALFRDCNKDFKEISGD